MDYSIGQPTASCTPIFMNKATHPQCLDHYITKGSSYHSPFDMTTSRMSKQLRVPVSLGHNILLISMYCSVNINYDIPRSTTSSLRLKFGLISNSKAQIIS